MSFRLPPTLRTALPNLAKGLAHQPSHLPFPILKATPSPVASTSRLFSSAPKPQISFKAPATGAAGVSGVFAAAAKRFGSRGVSGAAGPTYGAGAGQQVDWTKVATNVGIAAVAAFGLNYALNREQRGALGAHEAQYLHDTFKWTAAGLAITAGTAYALFRSGSAVRLMQANPWVVMGIGLVGGIGSMMGVFYTSPDSPAHYLSWAAFTAIQGVTLSPLFFLNPAILGRAGIYTLGALGGLCYVGATAKSDEFLYLGGFLMAGLGVVLVSSLAPMLLPRMSMRTMSTMEHVSAYGGVAVFSGFILYDTQKILKHAALVQRRVLVADPVRESVSLILDAINLFTRIVQVMLLQQRQRK